MVSSRLLIAAAAICGAGHATGAAICGAGHATGQPARQPTATQPPSGVAETAPVAGGLSSLSRTLHRFDFEEAERAPYTMPFKHRRPRGADHERSSVPPPGANRARCRSQISSDFRERGVLERVH